MIHCILWDIKSRFANKILQKLIAYVLLVKSLNDASFPYTYKKTPYAGKPVDSDGPYYIDTVEYYVKYLVNHIETDVSLKGGNISGY